MVEFLVEAFLASSNRDEAHRAAERASAAARQMTREGVPVRLLRSVFVPDDETCFYLYEATSAEDVREAVRRADLPYERLSEALASPKGEER